MPILAAAWDPAAWALAAAAAPAAALDCCAAPGALAEGWLVPAILQISADMLQEWMRRTACQACTEALVVQSADICELVVWRGCQQGLKTACAYCISPHSRTWLLALR